MNLFLAHYDHIHLFRHFLSTRGVTDQAQAYSHGLRKTGPVGASVPASHCHGDRFRAPAGLSLLGKAPG